MKHALFSIVLGFSLFGAGCRFSETPIVTPSAKQEVPIVAPSDSQNSVRSATDPLCTAPPTETEIGSRAYPIAAVYQRLPHLGQIFTALDCGDRKRAQGVFGFSNGVYTAGISLKLKEMPPVKIVEKLKTLGFVQDKELTLKNTKSLSLEQLKTLRDILIYSEASVQTDFEINRIFLSEDCINCG